jgi:transposase InsO family protein
VPVKSSHTSGCITPSPLDLDFAGPLQGKMYLILIDVHSKWIEAFCTPNATSHTVIEQLRTVFAQFGLPETVVTDNGTCFVSAEFESFLKVNGIKHLTSAPYHPASNGLAERAVQMVKKGLKKTLLGSISSHLATTLMSYRLTPQSTTGVSPAELLLGKQPRSRLDLLKPHTAVCRTC